MKVFGIVNLCQCTFLGEINFIKVMGLTIVTVSVSFSGTA